MTPTSPDSGAPSPLLLLGDCADKMRDPHYFDIASRRIATARQLGLIEKEEQNHD